MNLERQIAQALLDIKAVKFSANKPYELKSGLKSPVYVDNRLIPSHPEVFHQVIDAFATLIKEKGIVYDVIAGIETAGIPHSSALGYSLKKPSVFVRKDVKDHGTKKAVEGGEVSDKKVLLIEDHVTTAGSSLRGVEALRAVGAEVNECLAITTYGFPESDAAFMAAGVMLHTLTTFAAILTEAVQKDLLTAQEKQIVTSWLRYKVT